jgi:tetratricopeptide (TPR) repeat protein
VALYRKLGDVRPGLEDALESLSLVRGRRGDRRLAAALAEEAIEVARARGRHDARLAALLRRAGEEHALAGEFARAEPLLREALERAERAHGPRSTRAVAVRLALARMLAFSGRTREGRALADRALADAARPPGEGEPYQIVETRRLVFEVLQAQGDLAGMRQTVADAFADLGPEAPDSFAHAVLLIERGTVETGDRQFERARQSLRMAAAMVQRLGLGAGSPIAQMVRLSEAEWHLARGDAAGALERLEAMQAAAAAGPTPVFSTSLGARALAAAGRHAEAAALVDRSLASLESDPARAYQADLEAGLLEVRAGLRRRHGDCAGAALALGRARELLEDLHVPDSPRRLAVERALVTCRAGGADHRDDVRSGAPVPYSGAVARTRPGRRRPGTDRNMDARSGNRCKNDRQRLRRQR